MKKILYKALVVTSVLAFASLSIGGIDVIWRNPITGVEKIIHLIG